MCATGGVGREPEGTALGVLIALQLGRRRGQQGASIGRFVGQPRAAAPLSVPPSQGPALQRWASVLRLRGGSTGGMLVSQALPPRGSQCTQWPVCGLREVLRQGSRVRGALESLDDAAHVWLSHAPPADLELREDAYAACCDAATLAVSRARGN